MTVDGSSPSKCSDCTDNNAYEENGDGNENIGDAKELHGENIKMSAENYQKPQIDNDNDIVLAEQIMQKFLLQAIGKSRLEVYDMIKNHGEKILFKSEETILRKGDAGKGLFLILVGRVGVLTTDNTIIKTLYAGDFFGDISTIFDIPVTATIECSSNSTIVLISKPEIKGIIAEYAKNLDVIDWCIKRRYLPTGGSIDNAKTYRRLGLNTLKRLPLFAQWSEQAIKQLIISLEHTIVTLYPAKSLLVLENDPLTSMYVIINGTIDISHGTRLVERIEISCLDELFVFTETAMLLNGKVSPVSIRAVDNCQVICIEKYCILNILENDSDLMNLYQEKSRAFYSAFQQIRSLYMQYEPDLQIELLSRKLKDNKMFHHTENTELEKIILDSDFEEVSEGSKILVDLERDRYNAVLLILGEIGAKSRRKHSKDPSNSAKVDTNNIKTSSLNADTERGLSITADVKLSPDHRGEDLKRGLPDTVKEDIVKNSKVANNTEGRICEINERKDRVKLSTNHRDLETRLTHSVILPGSLVTIGDDDTSLTAITDCLIMKIRPRHSRAIGDKVDVDSDTKIKAQTETDLNLV